MRALLLAIALAIATAPQAPARIVSTSPSVTETLFALGLGDRVVGVSMYCRFPAAVAKLPKVGSVLNPDAERIAALRPDLVFVHQLSNGLDRRLNALKIPFVVVGRGSLSQTFTAIRQIGAGAGAAARADTLIEDIQRRLDGIRRAHESSSKPRVLFIIGRRPGMLADLVAVGSGGYINELIGIAGGVNVLEIRGQPEYPRISMEVVLRMDPDVIVDSVDMGDTDAERDQRAPVNARLWAAYPRLKAVANKRVYAATTDALVVPGPRVVDAALWMADVIHGRLSR